MSRRVGCSYGKQAGFVGAKINIISEHSKYFETFLQKKQEIGIYIDLNLYFCTQIEISNDKASK